MKKNTVKDEELALLAQKGDKQSMDELLSRYSAMVRCRAREYFLAGGETEDLIQEGMIGLYHAISDYKQEENGASFKNFAYLCVRRRIVDAVKSASRKKNVPLNGYVSLFVADDLLPPIDPEYELMKDEEKREFLQKMSKVLSDFEFRVVIMYMEGFSTSEMCEATKKTSKSIDNAIQRSKKKLQKLLKIEQEKE